jgi:23S rRNA (adenine-N6)-dimethyltransferase
VALAQNFLRDARAADALLNQTALTPDDVVCEIGRGTGTLTDRLARRCHHVVAIEKDARLADALRRHFAARPNVTVFEGDFLAFPLPVTRYKVVANPPFNVIAAVVTKLADTPYPPEDTYLVVQREAAQRFAGDPLETLASVRLKPWFEPSVVHRFARRDFVPEPGVDVVLLRLRKRGPPLVPDEEVALFRDFVAHGFSAWQPSLRRAYAGVLDARAEPWLRQRLGAVEARPRLDATPRQLSFDEWLALFWYFKESAHAPHRAPEPNGDLPAPYAVGGRGPQGSSPSRRGSCATLSM